ncbi:MAG: Ig-like domain-containing protein [Ignavibacteriota bacterium]
MILYPIAPNPAAIVVGDFNGDGRPDIFAGQYPGFSVLYGVSGVITATGTPQTAFLGASFASPLAATIQDTGGNPIAGVTVAYATAQAGAEAVLSSAAAVTNAAGVASITAIANNTAGSYTVLAGAGTLTTQFNLTNSVDVPASLTVLSGAPQSTAAGMPFPIPLKVLLKNAAGNPVSGATISFSTPPGILLASAAVATDATGQAQVYAKASDTPRRLQRGGVERSLVRTVHADSIAFRLRVAVHFA